VGVLEAVLAEEPVGMVGDAERSFHPEIPQSGFLFDFPDGAAFDTFTGLQFPLGKVPELVTENQKILSTSVPDQPATGGDFPEAGTEFRETGIVDDDAVPLEVNVLHYFLTFVSKAVAKLMFPPEFINGLRESLGAERAGRILDALSGEPEVSVRVNPHKIAPERLRSHFGDLAAEAVPWASDEGFYLKARPSFTLDPLFHAGAYYVQEASSMAVGGLFRQALSGMGRGRGLRILDLCAAPGGKTTQLLSHLDDASLLVTNELVPARATVLAENVARWGCSNVVVTNADPAAFTSLRHYFAGIVVDAPCSGEGMFRKDDRAVAEWSPDTVRLCAARQRRILADVWPSLAPGGFLIYSTCTFNRQENEENVAWICASLGAECLCQRHFYPGEDRGEGFFAALLRKDGAYAGQSVDDGTLTLTGRRGLWKLFPAAYLRDLDRLEKQLKVIASGTAAYILKGSDRIPEADFALAVHRDAVGGLAYQTFPVNREQALDFLSKRTLLFPDAPRGYLLLTWEGLGLGFVKNLGSRVNSLLPNARRIRMH